jgi:hypothetical protein
MFCNPGFLWRFGIVIGLRQDELEPHFSDTVVHMMHSPRQYLHVHPTVCI